MTTLLEPPEIGSSIPARVLLIDEDSPFAQRVLLTLVARAGARLWLWHERTPELALTLLTACGFDLIILALPSSPSPAARIVHAVAETAIGTPLLLLERDGGESSKLPRIPPSFIGTVRKGDIDGMWAAVSAELGLAPQLAAQ